MSARPAIDAQHRALLGVFHYALAAIVGCAGLAGFVQLGLLRTLFAGVVGRSADPLPGDMINVFSLVVIGVAVVLICVAITGLVAAPRYRRGEASGVQWLAAFLLLPCAPLGTALGVYALFWLSHAGDREIARASQPS